MRDEQDVQKVLSFLRAAKDAAVQVQRHSLRAQRLWDACTRTTSNNTGMPRGGGSTREDKLVLYCAACTEELAALWEEHSNQQQIAEFINRIENPTHRHILQFKYLDYLTWSQMIKALESVGIYYSERHIRKLHRLALISAAKIYDDEEKDKS